MSDYINYMDNNLIARADKAFDGGNYHLSAILYSTALDKLKQYQGDRMAPMMMAQSLRNKIRASERLLRRT